MTLLTEAQKQQLLHNGSPDQFSKDHFPVVKLFMPGCNFVWLLTELYPHTPNLAFGLGDLGMGFPEMGDVPLDEISRVKGPFGPVKCDPQFKGKYPLSVYADAARELREITEDDAVLIRHVKTRLQPE